MKIMLRVVLVLIVLAGGSVSWFLFTAYKRADSRASYAQAAARNIFHFVGDGERLLKRAQKMWNVNPEKTEALRPSLSVIDQAPMNGAAEEASRIKNWKTRADQLIDTYSELFGQ